jgi:hypothetical protein
VQQLHEAGADELGDFFDAHPAEFIAKGVCLMPGDISAAKESLEAVGYRYPYTWGDIDPRPESA